MRPPGATMRAAAMNADSLPALSRRSRRRSRRRVATCDQPGAAAATHREALRMRVRQTDGCARVHRELDGALPDRAAADDDDPVVVRSASRAARRGRTPTSGSARIATASGTPAGTTTHIHAGTVQLLGHARRRRCSPIEARRAHRVGRPGAAVGTLAAGEQAVRARRGRRPAAPVTPVADGEDLARAPRDRGSAAPGPAVSRSGRPGPRRGRCRRPRTAAPRSSTSPGPGGPGSSTSSTRASPRACQRTRFHGRTPSGSSPIATETEPVRRVPCSIRRPAPKYSDHTGCTGSTVRTPPYQSRTWSTGAPFSQVRAHGLLAVRAHRERPRAVGEAGPAHLALGAAVVDAAEGAAVGLPGRRRLLHVERPGVRLRRSPGSGRCACSGSTTTRRRAPTRGR